MLTFYILFFYTHRMNEGISEIKPAKTWQKTKHADLIRNLSSGNYYARFRVKGKLVWRSWFGIACSW
jgi:hypothetical protein